MNSSANLLKTSMRSTRSRFEPVVDLTSVTKNSCVVREMLEKAQGKSLIAPQFCWVREAKNSFRVYLSVVGSSARKRRKMLEKAPG